ncbi:hypothetical protein Moror_12715 [Moniliophthora roreri MCA 2997]|uniref:Tat pathway signal sequence n=2 Tax=Moniliophthora roreri TaxID=221103 RepID=V2YV21_MONRO|nr:hypothetical protein Moror_12715 [Moniliophthora roreri MCA 2997]
MRSTSIPYIPLTQEKDYGFEPLRSSRSSHSLTAFALIASLLLNCTLGAVWLSAHPNHCGPARLPQALYSPAQDAVEYVTVKFHSAFGDDIPIYDQEPSKEVDAAWLSLYEYAYNQVPRDQAALMPNKTYPVLDTDGQYMIALDVFHQLHCLNEMRKAMYPEYYPVTPEGIHTPHMRHCISSLRQSLMCSSDITPIVWQWSERSKAAKERSDVVHTCRNFDKIRDWAHDHFLDHQQDMSIFIEDDLEKTYF